uniref:UPF0716 protein FxsA n=1 Tax=Candidatus Kentrum sp. LPFa TaxID=2126335 RepID=A0A450X0S5_9GAMM|nr:MAG: UPF0716 protein FxsA [Candidatus Kentron sp. LPFa]VFK22877.1 MAG: UPF0716 protein FxsA [Candidatus Kentron sp. LPFa]
MSTFHWLFLFFLLTPIVEIYFLITVGSVIGAWPTVMLVVATALIGAYFVKQQGLSTLFRIRDGLHHGGDSSAVPGGLLEGMLILIAGALLLTPGFLTDTAGFVFLVPPWRGWIVSRFVPHWDNISRAGPSHAHGSAGGAVIEGNFRQEDAP